MNGPFTDSEEVIRYLARTDITGDEKRKRLKSEIRFARDSSTTLPKVDPLFRVQVTLPNKKRRDKTAEEFGEALVAYLGKKSDVINLEYETFKSSLAKMCSM